VVGTLVITLPVLVVFVIPKARRMMALRTAGGDTVIPLVVLVVLHSMVSHDLRQNYMLFAILAVLWGHWQYMPVALSKSLIPRSGEL
jgi:hypothetical protein